MQRWHSVISWWHEKKSTLRFLARFVVVVGLYYILAASLPFQEWVFPWYFRVNAVAAGLILRCLGFPDVHGFEGMVSSGRFSVTIAHGCDAIEPSAILVAAILAFPGRARAKILGCILGVLILAAANLVRIVSLFLTGVYFPRQFHTMHIDVWQPVFFLLVLILWILWVVRTRQPSAEVTG